MSDASKKDVRFGKRRAYILRRKLDPLVQRRDDTVLKTLLPPKVTPHLSLSLVNRNRLLVLILEAIDSTPPLFFSDARPKSRSGTRHLRSFLEPQSLDPKLQTLQEELVIYTALSKLQLSLYRKLLEHHARVCPGERFSRMNAHLHQPRSLLS